MEFLSSALRFTSQLTIITLQDPLEQFDVLALPIVGGKRTDYGCVICQLQRAN
jgi:hypothetical protein